MKKVSVIIPLYNVEDLMDRCIESVRQQTYKNIEIILVNDGSPDSCGVKAEEYAKLDSRIKVIHKENGGLSSARNAGLKKVTGDYILFVDSDDWINLTMIEEMTNQVENNFIDLVVCNYNKVYDAYTEYQFLSFKNEVIDVKKIGIKEYLFKYLFNYKHGDEVWNKLYKTEIIQQNQLQFEANHEVFSEDKLFNLYYLTFVHKIAAINKGFYQYLQRPGSLMNRPKPKIVQQYANLTMKYINFIENHKDDLKTIYPILAFHFLLSSLRNLSSSGARTNQIIDVLKENQAQYFKNYINKILFNKEVYDYCKKNTKGIINPFVVKGFSFIYILHQNWLIALIMKKISK